MDVNRYLEGFDRLRRQKRWSTHTGVLRFAALTLAAADLADPAAQLEAAADELKRRAGWTGHLASSVRYAVAAMILRHGLSAGRVHEQIGKVREGFRKRRIRRGGVSEVLAALILVLQNEGRAVPGATLDRMKAILERWKQDHRWLTGTDDYPMAALHAHRDASPDQVVQKAEATYQALRSHGFWRGDQLQLASHILGLGDGSGESAARRFRDLAKALEKQRERAGTSRYDELALLCLTSGTPSAVIRDLLKVRNELRNARPRPSKDIAFSLAVGLMLSREVARSKELGTTRDIAAISAAQALLEAQSAAMVAIFCATGIY